MKFSLIKSYYRAKNVYTYFVSLGLLFALLYHIGKMNMSLQFENLDPHTLINNYLYRKVVSPGKQNYMIFWVETINSDYSRFTQIFNIP